MDTTTSIATPTIPGTPFAGGFYVGRYLEAGTERALIVSPKALGELPRQAWNRSLERIDGALSFTDGLANTRAMAAAGSDLAKAALELRIAGLDDWCIPAMDQLELLYRYLKPTTARNYCGSGANASSLPPRHLYMSDDPAQTVIEAFRAGGIEALEDDAYWSSTQYAGGDGYAWSQLLDSGGQYDALKDDELLARAVRSEPIQ
jgi:hypothetical protein